MFQSETDHQELYYHLFEAFLFKARLLTVDKDVETRKTRGLVFVVSLPALHQLVFTHTTSPWLPPSYCARNATTPTAE